MAEKRGLGSGFSALFGDDYTAAPAESKDFLPISKVEPRADQPRNRFDEAALQELADSIEKYGVLQPITVRALDNGYYQIIAGERRWRAARMAGLGEVPVRIIEADDRRAMELALVENLQREDLNPAEEARGYRTLLDDYGLTQEEAAEAVGKSRPAVANALRLLSLGPETLALVEQGTLSAGHARTLLPLKDAAKQKQAADLVLEKNLSVRQTEALVKRLNAAPAKPKGGSVFPSVDYVKEVERDLENALGRKVTLHDGKKRGTIDLEFYGADDREKLIANLLLFGRMRDKN